MATGEQIKSLVKSYAETNDEKFKTVVLQIAAHEAKLGHDKLARELKMLVDKKDVSQSRIIKFNNQNPILEMEIPTRDISELIVNYELSERINRILNEYRNRNKLLSYGLSNRRKILLEGAPGTGKTLTASIIASELNLPLYTVRLDKMVTRFMGETSVKLRQIFDSMENNTGIYLFDEFDAIGADRSLDNEVGEMRRILSSFLQFIEQDFSESIIIAATNNPKILDKALFRRFDDVLHYSLPSENEIIKIFQSRLNSYDKNFEMADNLIKYSKGLSQAEIVRISEDAIKDSLLKNIPLHENKILTLIKERKNVFYNEA